MNKWDAAKRKAYNETVKRRYDIEPTKPLTPEPAPDTIQKEAEVIDLASRRKKS